MANTRGFVTRIEIGRAGLVVITLIHEDGTTADYHLPDLDADPERFNERLSKLGVLRDAMSRAEPVEIEYTQNDQGGAQRSIERVVRITRDRLDLPAPVQKISGLVVGVSVYAENRAEANGEKSDVAKVLMLTADETNIELSLDMQIPERHTAAAQLDIVREAQQLGRPLEFSFDARNRRITGVSTATRNVFPEPMLVDGFVESISHVETLAASIGIAFVRFTSAPAFGGAGNYVPLAAFTPQAFELYVVKGSDDYLLIEAGLRDGLRMRVAIARLGLRDDGDRPLTSHVPSSGARPNVGKKAEGDSARSGGVLIGAELLAPLASASRPVWIKISRRTLDLGPDGPACTEGVPVNDLSPATLRDLRLPYPAEWTGLGCFNHGVYRFQLALGVEFEIAVDGEVLCLHDGEKDSGVKFAHACLDGEHEVVVKLRNWTCDQQFLLDVYRIR